MLYFVAIFAALLPVILLFLYIYRQDSAQPEPAKWLWKAVCYGVASVFVASCFALVISPLLGDAVSADMQFTSISQAVMTAFFSAAIPEEAAKLLMLVILIRMNPYFDEHLDGIVYACCIGLGFAGLENVMYLVGNLDSLVQVAVTRAIFSVPGHFFFAVIMGYFVSLAHFSSITQSERKRNYILALLLPILLHGTFDSLLMSSSVNEGLAVILIIIFVIFCYKLNKQGRYRIRLLKRKDQMDLARKFRVEDIVW